MVDDSKAAELKDDAREAVAGVRAEVSNLGKADVGDYLTFRAMITPSIIQIIFWLGVAAIVIGGIGTMTQSFFAGLFGIVFGILFLRVFCELMLVTFKMNEGIQKIAKQGGLRSTFD